MCVDSELSSTGGRSKFISLGRSTERRTPRGSGLTRGPSAHIAEHWPCSTRNRLLSGFPAGYLHVDGIFLLSHREELQRFIRDEGDIATEADPRSRILGWENGDSQRLTVATATEVLAMELGRAKSVWGNIANRGSVDNLPADGCVEVECRIDRRGIHPVHFGPLPEQLAALNRAHMAVHELMVEALVERNRTKALYALSIDPLTAAVCSLEEIEKLFDEMWEEQRDFLTYFETGGG